MKLLEVTNDFSEEPLFGVSSNPHKIRFRVQTQPDTNLHSKRSSPFLYIAMSKQQNLLNTSFSVRGSSTFDNSQDYIPKLHSLPRKTVNLNSKLSVGSFQVSGEQL